MRTIGLVGGMTPESTVAYYQQLIRRCRERVRSSDPLHNPVVVVYSIDLSEIVALQRAGDVDGVAARLAAACERLCRAGAEIGALTANTPHLYLDAVRAQTGLELVSIVDATLAGALRLGVRRPLLLGTDRTMTGPTYPQRFAADGVGIVVPDAADRAVLDAAIYGELSVGTVRPEFRTWLLDLCSRHLADGSADAVILGCTELPLVVGAADLAAPVLDTTSLHVDAILDRALGS
jgi:aspartate racemase